MVIDERETAFMLPRKDLERLIEVLRSHGRTVIGPTVSDGAVVYQELDSAAALPHGVHDEQSPGHYRLVDGKDAADADALTFDYASSPSSWKRFTFPPVVTVGLARRDGDELTFSAMPPERPRFAFVGVRACDLAALRIQDKVLLDGPFVDQDYRSRRSDTLVVAVECATPSGTCFCSSMGTGPEVTQGHDLALTELPEGFVVRAGSRAGSDLIDRLALEPAGAARREAASAIPAAARARMGEPLPMFGLPDRLLRQMEHPRWAQVAERCLACTNCTLVCPTCFCTSVTQHSDLLGRENTSVREWDSCFPVGFASVAGGGNFRSRRKDRYRQWLTHKFGTWVAQFGTSGCVGCGRCITWCPVAIDIREELAVIAPLESRSVVDQQSLERPVAAGSGRYALGIVRSAQRETADTFTLTLTDLPEAILSGGPGQFLMLDLPGFPGVPISVSRYLPDAVELTIRAAGPSTHAITTQRPGSQIGLRGPLGRGWPAGVATGRDILIVAGGIGLAPLRPLIDLVLAQRSRFGTVRLCIGSRSPADLLFGRDRAAWAKRDDIELDVTVDRGDGGWAGPVGVVTQLFDRSAIDASHTTAYVCGPEKMMQVATRALAGRGLLPERVFLSMERHMQCGIGLCGHCQMGRFFVCRDGPVFSRAELGESFELEGI